MIFYVAIYSIVYFFALDKLYGVIQMAVVLAVPVIMTYNGQRGKDARINKFIKWAFYVYYPVHLALIGIVQSII